MIRSEINEEKLLLKVMVINSLKYTKFKVEHIQSERTGLLNLCRNPEDRKCYICHFSSAIKQ